MTQKQMIVLGVVLVALYVWNKNRKKTPQAIAAAATEKANETLPIAAAGLPQDVFQSIQAMQGPSIVRIS